LARAREFLWDCNGDRMRDVYERHIQGHQLSPNRHDKATHALSPTVQGVV
jgi:hypothetical protein